MAQRIIRQVNTTAVETPPAQDYVVRKTVVSTPPPQDYAVKKTIFRTYQALFYILGVIETLLGFRFLLKIMGANPASGFTQFVYALSAPFAEPFRGIVTSAVAGNNIAEWSTIIAMVVYAVIVWLIAEFFQVIKPVDEVEVEQTVNDL